MARAARQVGMVVAVVAATTAAADGASAATTTPHLVAESPAEHVNAAHAGYLESPMTLPLHVAWTVDLRLAAQPIIAGGAVFALTVANEPTYGSNLYALDPQTGATSWGPVFIGGPYPGSGLAYGDGRVYAVGTDSVVNAFDAVTGDEVWSVDLPDQFSSDSAPTYANGIVYAVAEGWGTTLYALSAVTGEILWTQFMGFGGSRSSPAVTDHGVYVSYSCANTYAFRPLDGAPLWSHEGDCTGGGGSSPVVAAGRVWVNDFHDEGVVLDVATGRQVAVNDSLSPPAFDDRRGYFVEGGVLVGRDPSTLAPLWTFNRDGGVSSDPVVVGDHVFTGTSAGLFYALDAETGAPVWSDDVAPHTPYPDADSAGFVRWVSSGDGLVLAVAYQALVAYASDTAPPAPPAELSLAWAWNPLGQVGDASTVDRHRAVPVAGAPAYATMSAGALHSLGLDRAGRVWAWGWNGVGQLGTGGTSDSREPVAVPGLTGVTAVAAGWYHSLALRQDGSVWAWGWNVTGQLGDGTTTDRYQPVRVPLSGHFVAVSAGLLHSIALRSDGTVWAWGWNGVGQLGDGTLIDRHLPVQVGTLDDVVAVDAGAHHNLAIRRDGSVLAWGWNGNGQLGDGTLVDRHLPVTVSQGAGYGKTVAVAAGAYHSLALTSRATVFAWGWNGTGALGDDTTASRDRPVQVAGLVGVTEIDAGGIHSLARTDDGAVYAWGWNIYGQLGDGTTGDRSRAVAVPGVFGASTVAGGVAHTLVA